MNRFTEDMKLWLFDLAHGNLSDDQIVKGFIRHYVLYGQTMDKVKDDIYFHTLYGMEGVKKAWQSLTNALENYVGMETGKGGNV